MPVYCFVCDRCGHREDHIRTMAKRDEGCVCSKCDPGDTAIDVTRSLMRRDICAENGQWSPNIDYDKPVFSESLGVHPSQVAKAQAKHPWMKYQSDGTLRIDSPAEYARVRKELGFVDRRPR